MATSLDDHDPSQWQIRMLRTLDKLRSDFCTAIPRPSRERFRVLFHLDMLEVQTRMGQVHEEDEIKDLLGELLNMANLPEIPKHLQGILETNIIEVRQIYFNHPRDLPPQVAHIMLLGETGAGKSSLGNVFLGGNCFQENSSTDPTTDDVATSRGKWLNKQHDILVIDTPGTNASPCADRSLFLHMAERLRNLEYITSFVLVFNASQCRLTATHRDTIEVVQTVFGRDIFLNAVVFFTHWPKDKASVNRRKANGEKEEDKVKEINRILREAYDLEFNVPCYFVDSMECKDEDGVSSHQATLNTFYGQMKRHLPYNTIKIRDLHNKTQELHRLLHQLRSRIHEYRDHMTPEERQLISSALELLNEQIGDQPHLGKSSFGSQRHTKPRKKYDPKNGKPGPKGGGGSDSGGGGGGKNPEGLLRRMLNAWRKVSRYVKYVGVAIQAAERAVPEQYRIYLRGAQAILAAIVLGLDALDKITDGDGGDD